MNWLLKKKNCENPFESLFTFFFFYWEGFILKLKGDDNDLSGENLGGMHSTIADEEAQRGEQNMRQISFFDKIDRKIVFIWTKYYMGSWTAQTKPTQWPVATGPGKKKKHNTSKRETK